MTQKKALEELEKMTDAEFDKFLNSLPQRTQLCIKGGLCDWRSVCPEWYIKQKGGD